MYQNYTTTPYSLFAILFFNQDSDSSYYKFSQDHFPIVTAYFPDIDECLMYPSLCKEPAKCVNTPGMYECRCPLGFKYDFASKSCNGETNPNPNPCFLLSYYKESYSWTGDKSNLSQLTSFFFVCLNPNDGTHFVITHFE